jgi:hypothetical protein
MLGCHTPVTKLHVLAVKCCIIASEEHRTENRLKPQSVYTQTVVVNEHLSHFAARKVQMKAGIEENRERDFFDEIRL